MERKIGEVTHYFAGPSAAVLRLSAQLKVGDEIHVTGATTDLSESVSSMQIDHNSVETAGPGDDVAILVKDRVREGDEVFLVEEGAEEPAAVMPAASMPVTPAMPVAIPPTTSTPVAKAPTPKPAAKPKAKPKAKAKAKAKPKKVKAKAKPKAKAKAKKAKAKAKPKAKAKSKTKAKAKKKKR